MFPSFTDDENEGLRRVLYGCVMLLVLSFALVWLIFLATREEIKRFLGWVILALFWLGVGLFFYGGKYPEAWFPKSRFVAIWISSHTWWHIAAALSANQLLWL